MCLCFECYETMYKNTNHFSFEALKNSYTAMYDDEFWFGRSFKGTQLKISTSSQD